MKISAIIVTYNRLPLLQRAVECLRQQTRPLDCIVVVNNSSPDGTGQWLASQHDLDVVTQPNVGGSGGFYTGLKHAYESGSDKIWCMDDDVYPQPQCLERLLACDDEHTGILCPVRWQDDHYMLELARFNLTSIFRRLHYRDVVTADIQSREFNYIEGMSFEGPLIDRKVVDRIGLPNKELFILFDDSDYSYRAVLAGFKVKLVSSAVMGKELFKSNADAVTAFRKTNWKVPYMLRNTVYFNKTYGRNFAVRYVRTFFSMFKFECCVAKNILFNKKYDIYDFARLFRAYRDGMAGRLGKIDY